MVDRKGFSLTEIMVAITLLAVLCVPIINNLRTSKNQTQKLGKKIMVTLLAQTVFDYFQLEYTKTQSWANLTGEKTGEYQNIQALLTEMGNPYTNADLVNAINSNYKNFIITYKIKPDSSPDYRGKIAMIELRLNWVETDGGKEMTFYSELVRNI